MLQHAESSLQSADFNLDYDRQSEHGYDPARLHLRDIRRLRFILYLMVVEAQLRLQLFLECWLQGAHSKNL